MTEEIKKDNNKSDKDAAKAVVKSVYGERKKKMAPRKEGFRRERDEEEFEQRIIDIARVTRVMAGGKRMRFRACVAIGNKKGRVAVGLAKGADVTNAVTKAVNAAKKQFVEVPIINDTIPHEIIHKSGAAVVLFKPARKGRGVIAGGVVRVILELAGIKNVTSKILGTNSKLNNAKCVVEALDRLKKDKKTKAAVEAAKSEAKAEEAVKPAEKPAPAKVAERKDKKPAPVKKKAPAKEGAKKAK